MSFWSSVAKGIGGLGLGTVTGGALALGEPALAYKGQKDANQSNERIARENRQFQERMVNQAQDFEEEMSSSAYQRTMSDMRQAGLNPILAYQQGGATTPIGKTAPGAGAVMQNVFGGMQGSPIDTLSTAAGINKMGAEVMRIDSEIDLMASQVGMNRETTEKIKEEARKIQSEIKNIEANTTGVEADNAKRLALKNFFEENPNAAIVSEYGGKGTVALSTVLGALGLSKFESFARDVIERVRSKASSINIDMGGSRVPQPNPLTDRY